MRRGQHRRKHCAAAAAALLISLSHGNAASICLTNTTFEYNESKSFTELTNSIQQVKDQLDFVERRFGNTSTNVAGILSKLAGLYDDMGDYAQAASLDRRALPILEQLRGRETLQLADTLDDLAWEYREMGDYDQALPLFQQSLTMTEHLPGRENPDVATTLDSDVATTLDSMADVYCDQGDYAQALSLCQRGLEIRTKVLGPDCPDIVDSLLSLGNIYKGLGDYSKALTMCQRGIDIAERRLRPDHPLVADHLFLLGQLREDLGNYDEAFAAFRRALAIDEKISGPEHPDALQVLDELAVLYGRQLDLQRSLSTCVELFKRQRRYFVGQTLALSDSAALRFIQSSFQSAEFFHSICAEAATKNLGNANLLGARELALGKAFLEEVRAAQAAFDVDPSTQVLRQQYRVVQNQLERLTRGKLELAKRETLRRDLESEQTKLETQLAERVALVAQTVRERNLTLTDIARALPSDSALLDFIQYHRFDFASKTNRWGEQRYAVYLTFPLASDSTNIVVERVDLGEAASINNAVELLCERMSAGYFASKDLPVALHQLGELLYAPLTNHLRNVSHLIVCPDGQLSRLPFEMLRLGDTFLVEQKTISYVTSGREIARLARHASPQISAQNRKSLVMGNPDFDLDLAKASTTNIQVASSATIVTHGTGNAKQNEAQFAGKPTTLRSLSRDYRGLKFQPLPGTEAEARSVAKQLGDKCILRLGVDAREAELRAVMSPRVLHLATHGFFLSDQTFNYTNGLSNKLAFSGDTDLALRGGLPPLGHDWKNPLVRCGIALAGANHAMQATNAVVEDGVVTGLEASLLNLQGTELVILSACDSGTGEVKIGEGVMSLRRAFRIAGAQTVLASHWKVSDRATTKLITAFVRRWQSGVPRAKAWREAQLELLRSKGSSDDYSDPYFWSAFTLTGQWR